MIPHTITATEKELRSVISNIKKYTEMAIAPDTKPEAKETILRTVVEMCSEVEKVKNGIYLNIYFNY